MKSMSLFSPLGLNLNLKILLVAGNALLISLSFCYYVALYFYCSRLKCHHSGSRYSKSVISNLTHFITFITLMSRTDMWTMGMRTLNAGTGLARVNTSYLPSVMLLDWETSGDFHIWPIRMEGVCRHLVLLAVIIKFIFFLCNHMFYLEQVPFSSPILWCWWLRESLFSSWKVPLVSSAAKVQLTYGEQYQYCRVRLPLKYGI